MRILRVFVGFITAGVGIYGLYYNLEVSPLFAVTAGVMLLQGGERR